MIQVKFNDTTFECSRAVKGPDYIRLYDAQNIIIVAFEKVTDFSAFTITGGDWEIGKSANEEALTNLGVADYPVEKGTTTDGYTYEKWNSGTFKMWGKVTFSYDSEEYLISPQISYPVRLIESPLLFFSYAGKSPALDDANNIGVTTTRSQNTLTHATTKQIKYRDTAWESSHTVTMGMYVIGKWK